MEHSAVDRFVEDLLLVTTNHCNALTGLHTLKVTVTTAHIKSSMSSIIVAW
jgi:hypothetical protein